MCISSPQSPKCQQKKITNMTLLADMFKTSYRSNELMQPIYFSPKFHPTPPPLSFPFTSQEMKTHFPTDLPYSESPIGTYSSPPAAAGGSAASPPRRRAGARQICPSYHASWDSAPLLRFVHVLVAGAAGAAACGDLLSTFLPRLSCGGV
jgi:hypothetical protein